LIGSFLQIFKTKVVVWIFVRFDVSFSPTVVTLSIFCKKDILGGIFWTRFTVHSTWAHK